MKINKNIFGRLENKLYLCNSKLKLKLKLKYMPILAKSTGTTLLEHSKCVEKIGLFMARSFIRDEKIIENIRLACLLHDIGKCDSGFQNYIKDNIKADRFIYHQEIGWAILSNILKDGKPLDESLISSIYWHHANPTTALTNRDTSDRILESLEEINGNNNDIVLIKELIRDFIGDYEYITKDNNLPEFYSRRKDINEKSVLIRSVLMAADRLASQLFPDEVRNVLASDDECQRLVLSIEYKPTAAVVKPMTYNEERYNAQVECANLARANNTVVIKAPAGYGKTIVGLLWSAQSNKKLIWVCPRNVIVESVYDSILNEIRELNMNVSVELYLTGERKKCTNENIKDFESDIVVTNIDNYLSPVVKNKTASRAFSICSQDVVFDEYHELVTDSALFACFINIMRIRHRLTNSNTLLLSATPSLVHTCWDSIEHYTTLLPDADHHYSPAHNGVYKINIIDEIPEPTCIKDIETLRNESSLIIVNSIANSQVIRHDRPLDILIHSDFLPEDKEEILNKITKAYSKVNVDAPNKPSVVSSPIIQASMDISFINLTESVLSPEATLQRIGRCDRWGNYQSLKPEINIIKIANKSESGAIKTLYNISLKDLWFKFITSLNGKIVNLIELYDVYNNFNKINKTAIINYIKKEKLESSLNALCEIKPPVKYTTERSMAVSGKGSDNNVNLRTAGDSFYCIFRINNSEDLTAPFQIEGFKKIDEILKEDNNTLRNVERIFRRICDNYGYGRGMKKRDGFTLKKLEKGAKYENTPYIGLNKTYDKEYGLVKNSLNIL